MIGNKIIALKGDRSLFAQFVINSRSWPEVNMKEVIGTYEFSTIPRALFHMSDSVHPCKNKAELMHILQHLPEGSNDDEAMNEGVDTVPNQNDWHEDPQDMNDETATVFDLSENNDEPNTKNTSDDTVPLPNETTSYHFGWNSISPNNGKNQGNQNMQRLGYFISGNVG